MTRLSSGERYTKGDLVMRFRLSGPAEAHSDAQVFVLVHGIGVSSRYFARLATELSASASVISLDLPGFGPNAAPGRHLPVEDFGKLVAEFLADKGVLAPVLVGHSMGAQIVVDVAQRYPAAGIVLIGPVVDERARSASRQGIRLFRDTFHESPRANWIVFSDYLRSGIRWYLTELPAMLAYRIEQQLPAVDAPVLIMRGANDTVAPDGWVRALARRSPGSRVITVQGAGHVVQHARPRVVSDELLRFASTVATRSAVVSQRDEESASPAAYAGAVEQREAQGAGPSTP